jgi:hypothetical protein
MRAERTADEQVVNFVVRDLPGFDDVIAQGRFTATDFGDLSLPVAALISNGDIDEDVVMGERVSCRRGGAAVGWSILAPKCAEALRRSLVQVDHTERLRSDMARAGLESARVEVM